LNVMLINTSDFANPFTPFSRSYFILFNGSDKQLNATVIDANFFATASFVVCAVCAVVGRYLSG